MIDKQQPGKWPFLYVDGKLIGPVNIGATVRVYPHVGLENLAGLHRKRFKSVDDMLTAVKTLLPKAKRLELREGQAAAGDLLALLENQRVALTAPPTKAPPSRKAPKAAPAKRRPLRT
jgi:hypothetical protein